MATRYWVGGTGTWDSSTTTHWSASSGGAGGASAPGSADSVIFDINSGSSFVVTTSGSLTVSTVTMANPTTGTGTLALGANLVATTSFTYTSGNITLNNFSITTAAFLSSNSNTRTLAFGTSGAINLNPASTSTPVNIVGTSLTVTGKSAINLSGAAASGVIRTITLSTFTASNALNVYVTGGNSNITVTPTTPFVVGTFDFSRSPTSTCNLSGVAITSYGSLSLPSVTTTTSTTAISFLSTNPGNIIKSNGASWWAITFNGIGTLNLNNQLFSMRAFSSNNSNTRSINFGTSGYIQLWGATATLWETSTTTNMTIQGTSKVQVMMYQAAANSMNCGSITTNPVNFYYVANGRTAGVTVTHTGNVGILDTTGMGTTYTTTISAATSLNIYGNLNLNNFTTISTPIINFVSPSSGTTINANGATISSSPAINFTGTGTWTLSSALSATGSAITHTSGTIITSGYSIAALSYNVTAPTVAVLNLGTSTLTLSGTPGWNVNYTTGSWTLIGGTSTISLSGATPVFNGLGLTYYNVAFSNAASTSITINGANTFNNLSIATPTTSHYVPVNFGANQIVNGTLSITGTTAGNYRLLFRSTVQDAVRTVTATAVSNISDIDFLDFTAAGASSPWTGTRLGNAGNATGVTFTSPVTVTSTATGGGSWSGTAWSSTRGTGAVAFPLPQDTVTSNISGSGAALTIDYSFYIGSVTLSGSGNQAMSVNAGVVANFIGSVNMTNGGGGSSSWFGSGTIRLYSRSNATQTLIMANGLSNPGYPIVIDTNGTVQLGGALTTTNYISHVGGTFSTQNYALSALYYDSTNVTTTRTLNLGSSSVTFTYATDANHGFYVNTSGYTLNAGTSTITIPGVSFGCKSDGNLTFYNVTYSNAAYAYGVTGSLDARLYSVSYTYNNLSYPARTTASLALHMFTGLVGLNVNGTLTIGAGSTQIYRTFLQSIDRVISVSVASPPTLSNVDFSGFNVVSTTWNGSSSCGNAGNNTNITFPAAKTSYWVGGTSGWNAGWASSSGGSALISNFPLAQDTAVFDNTGSAGMTVTQSMNYVVGTINASARTNTMTLAVVGGTMYTTGNVTLPSAVTITGTNGWQFIGDGTQVVTISSSIPQSVRFQGAGTVQLGATFTCTNSSGAYLIGGGLSLNGFNLVTPAFISDISIQRTISFGTNNITVNGNSSTIISIPTTGGSNLSISGTPLISATYSGSVRTRTVDTSGQSHAKAISINVTAGTDILTIGTSTTNSGLLNLNTTGFAGTWNHASALNLYGNMTVSSSAITIQDVSFNYVGTTASTLTTNGKTLNGKMIINSNGGSFTLQDNLTLTKFATGPISYLQLQQGTFAANNKTLTIDRLSVSGTATKTLSMGSGTWTITANDDATSGAKSWDVISSTGLTVVPATSTISLTGSGTRTFNGGSQSYNNMTIGTANSITNILGQNIFATVNNATQPLTINFNGNAAQSFTNFNISGTAGNLIILNSTTSANATLYKASTWNVGTHSVNGGNNVGLSFVSGSNDYLTLSTITGTNVSPLPPAIYMTGGTTATGGYSITF